MKRILALLAAFLYASASLAATSETWQAGKGTGYTQLTLCTNADMGSLASGNAVRCTTNQPVTNQSNQDIFAAFSINLASVTTPAGALWIGVYICPLNQDTTTYCDNRFASTAAGPPDASYQACYIYVVPSVTAAIVGTCTGIVLPPTSFEVVIYNGAGVALASTPGTLKMITYNRQQQ